MKNLQFLLVLWGVWFINLSINAQNLHPQWDKTIGGINNENAEKIIPTLDGGFMLFGSSKSPSGFEKSMNSKGLMDYWVVKIDQYGNKIWDKTIGGDLDDYLGDAISTSDGGYLMVGTSESPVSGDKTVATYGGYDFGVDFWLVKIDADGNIIWDKTIQYNVGCNNDYGGSLDSPTIIATDDDNFLIGGTVRESDDCPDLTFEDYIVIKIDVNGNKIWDKVYGSEVQEYFKSVISDGAGNFLLAGSFGNAQADYWIIKIDANGNKIWDKTFGGDSDDECNKIILTTDGNFLLLGKSDSEPSRDKTSPNLGDSDIWLVKIDANGNKIWDKTIGGSSTDNGINIILDGDGFMIIADSYSDISGNKTENSRGGTDYWLIKIDSFGNFSWDKTIGGNSNENAAEILAIPNGIMVFGSSKSTISGDKTENVRGNGFQDFWLAKLVITPTIPQISPLCNSRCLYDFLCAGCPRVIRFKQNYVSNYFTKNFNEYVWANGGGKLTIKDNKAYITGTLIHPFDNTIVFDVYIKLVNSQMWHPWAIQNRSYFYETSEAKGISSQTHTEWNFWELSPDSYLLGKQGVTGTLYLKPYTNDKESTTGFQLGLGGNGIVSDLGIGGNFILTGSLTYKNKIYNINSWGVLNAQISDEMLNSQAKATEFTPITVEKPNKSIVYPNPSHESTTVDTEQLEDLPQSILLYDFRGKLIQQIVPSASKTKILLNELKSGWYIIKIVDKTGLVHIHKLQVDN